jgi:hypothetical protein
MVKRSYNPYIQKKENVIFNPEFHDIMVVEGKEYIVSKRSKAEQDKINQLLYQ